MQENKDQRQISIPDDLVFGLDIGTRNIVGTVGYRQADGHFVVVSQAARQHETRAMLDGQIHDIGKVAETILAVRTELEEQIGRKLQNVCIAAAGRVLKTVNQSAEMEFSEETVVTSEHVYSLDMLAVEKAHEGLMREENGNMKFFCVGYSVMRYYQNDYPISNLEGHKCSKVATDLIATFLPEEVVDGLYAAVQRAGLQVENLTLEPIAAINIAIPEKFRLLNIALVDVGAGTSDISITKDGSIIAYGMIPYAGDELTEQIAKEYLVDFQEAERIKCASTLQDEVEYQDIMGLPGTLTAEEIAESVSDTVEMITKSVAEKIIELNGDKSVSAVFVVGGGGKMRGFTEKLAEHLGLQKGRVALRGTEVLGEVQFLQHDLEVDSLLVTPIGICLNYYEQKNNFAFVNVNGERVKLYDNGRLSILDAAMQYGLPNEQLFPQRGDALTYTVNGEKRMLRGEPGESAVVRLNGEETGLRTKIAQNDIIEIKASTKGVPASMEVEHIPEYTKSIAYYINGTRMECPAFVSANGQLVSGFYQIQDGDDIQVLDYYTLEQVFAFLDLPMQDDVQVNHVEATPETKVYENFTVDFDMPETLAAQFHDMLESEEEAAASADNVPASKADAAKNTQSTAEKADAEKAKSSPEKRAKPSGSGAQPRADTISITVNGDPVVLSGKASYILVDVLDVVPIDTSEAHGDYLETKVNGENCDFTKAVSDGDTVILQWQNK